MHNHPRLPFIVNYILQQPAHRDIVQIAVGELIEFNEGQLLAEWRGLVLRTSLESAQLSIRIIPAEQQCMACFLKYHPDQKETACPQCGSVGAKIISGEDFFLESF